MKKDYLNCLIIFLLLINSPALSQNYTIHPKDTLLINKKLSIPASYIYNKYKSGTESDVPDIGGFVYFLIAYALNPILQIEKGKGYWGWTKEISLGFVNLGQYRMSFEYSFVDREYQTSMIRGALKYDIFLKSKINLHQDPIEAPVLTLGGGYYTDFLNSGYFPEITFGYSYRFKKNLLYPSIKFRYTIVNGNNNTSDISLGLIYGFNPFSKFSHKKTGKKN